MNQNPTHSVEVTLQDAKGTRHDFEMPITFRALKRLNAAGINPTGIVLQGENYEMPEMAMVAAVAVGITEAGGKWSEDEVGEAMLLDGFLHFQIPLSLYLVGFGTGGLDRKQRAAAAEEGAAIAKKKGSDGTGSETATSSQSQDGGSPPPSSGP